MLTGYVSIVPVLHLTEKLHAKEYVKDGVRWATDAMSVWLMPVNTVLSQAKGANATGP